MRHARLVFGGDCVGRTHFFLGLVVWHPCVSFWGRLFGTRSFVFRGGCVGMVVWHGCVCSWADLRGTQAFVFEDGYLARVRLFLVVVVSHARGLFGGCVARVGLLRGVMCGAHALVFGRGCGTCGIHFGRGCVACATVTNHAIAQCSCYQPPHVEIVH